MEGLFEKLPVILPAILMGALIPLAAIFSIALTSARKKAYFPLILHGFATFFASLAIVGVSFLILARSLLGSVSVAPADGDRVVMIAGCVILLVFYLAGEALRYAAHKNALKKEGKTRFGGLLFGAGFILAQNLLVLGIAISGAFTMAESFGFGIMMMICAIIYLLTSEIGYQSAADGHLFVGSALASVYFIVLAVMLVIANVVATYVAVALALVFVLAMGYVLLPLPFKKEGGRI